MSRYNTPLRYPGGKQKLAPFITEVLAANDLVGAHYAEPYAGGAGVAMELLLSRQVSHVHLNDASVLVHAFWDSVLNRADEFCRRIQAASLTVEEWRRQKEIISRPGEFDNLDLGFCLFYLNRCNRSGIPKGGLIGGIKQTGRWRMDVRFPRNELIRRVEAISLRREDITLRDWDAQRYTSEYLPGLSSVTLTYCDPPYFRQSDRLYFNRYTPADHARIAGVIQNTLRTPWVVSYDSVPEILKHYEGRRQFTYDLQYHAARAYKGQEVFVFSDGLRLPLSSAVQCIDKALNPLHEGWF